MAIAFLQCSGYRTRMAKPKRRYVCSACGSLSHRWQGQCPDCAEWNTLERGRARDGLRAESTTSRAAVGGFEFVSTRLAPGATCRCVETDRAGEEFDRALGGGLVPGSAILMGGDPGHRQVDAAAPGSRCGGAGGQRWPLQRSMSAARKPAGQVRMRAGSAGAGRMRRCGLAAATSCARYPDDAGDEGGPPALLVIDSIQTMHSDSNRGRARAR